MCVCVGQKTVLRAFSKHSLSVLCLFVFNDVEYFIVFESTLVVLLPKLYKKLGFLFLFLPSNLIFPYYWNSWSMVRGGGGIWECKK